MFESKYSKFLTVLLIVVIIAIVGLLAFFGYDLYQKYFITKDTSEYVDAFLQDAVDENIVDTNTDTNTQDSENPFAQIQSTNTTTSSSSSSGKKPTYKGFNVLGTIEIPKTNIKYPILENETKKSIEVAVARLYGPGPNLPGNTIIAGHNYRNGLFFSNNKKLNIGDKIYITDNSGNRVSYTIYNKYETDENDTEYMTRDTGGAREISLSTCTDDSKARLIIWAKADND